MALITDKQMTAKPSTKDIWLFEPFARGLGSFCGRITPRGERLFYYRYTGPGRKQDILALGVYNTKGSGLTVAEARAKAQELARTYAGGAKDLRSHLTAEAERAATEAKEAALAKDRRKTFRQVFDLWLRTLKPHTDSNGKRQGRKDSGAATQQQFERRVFGSLGHIPIEDIKKPDILAILAKAREEGVLRTANILLSDLKQLFGFAEEWEYIQSNPVRTITKKHAGGATVVRERFLSDDEVKALYGQLTIAKLPKRTELAIGVFLSTACRISELAEARWPDVDLEKRNWHIPTSKNQRFHNIYLSDFAVKQFKALLALRSKDKENKDTQWVVPNRAGDGNIHVKTMGKQFADRQRIEEKRLQGRSKQVASLQLEGGRWTAHDLRRTAATIMSSLGVSNDVIDECMNHIKEGKMARVYIQDRKWDEQRVAFIKLGSRLEQLIEGKTTGQVIHLGAA